MSQGSPRIILRVPSDMLDAIRAAIDSNNTRRGAEPYDLSGWIRQAIQERLDKLARSRKSSGRKARPAVEVLDAEPSPIGGVIHPKEGGEDGSAESA